MKSNDNIAYAASIVPSERQLAWQDLEFYAFIHFGMNTFTNVEWGTGNEDPELFNPTALDARQWAKLAKLSGMRAMILTCKHHDGFCLWPSAYTDHSVKYSPWKDGNGDVVKECADACREYGLKFGVYLSPWDRHDPRYGDSEAYNRFYKNQLTELLTNYGDIFCVWLDGACGEGKNGKKQEYDWEGYYALIRKLQPDACICVTGPDVRWVGNEAGICRSSEWSVVPYWHSQHAVIESKSQQNVTKPPRKFSPQDVDLGSRKAIKGCNNLIWYPAEVNTSLRKGWFYHESEDYSLKSLSKLTEIYYNSVGANGSFLLNLSPNKEGKICERDVEAMLSLGAQLEIDFNENLAEGSVITDNRHLDEAHCGQMALSDNTEEYWHSGNNPDGSELILDLGDDSDIDKIVLAEHIRTGQQIEKYSVYLLLDNKWKRVSEGTVIGHKRICRFKEQRVQFIKVVIEQARCFATLSKFEAY